MGGKSEQHLFFALQRNLSSGVMLLVPLAAIVILGLGSLNALRGENILGGLFDARAYAPVAPAKQTPRPTTTAGADDGVLEVRLTAWEDTAKTISSPQ